FTTDFIFLQRNSPEFRYICLTFAQNLKLGKMGKIFRIAAGCNTGPVCRPFCKLDTPFLSLKTPFCTRQFQLPGGCEVQCKTKSAISETMPISANFNFLWRLRWVAGAESSTPSDTGAPHPVQLQPPKHYNYSKSALDFEFWICFGFRHSDFGFSSKYVSHPQSLPVPRRISVLLPQTHAARGRGMLTRSSRRLSHRQFSPHRSSTIIPPSPA